jgi:hypothetical protein
LAMHPVDAGKAPVLPAENAGPAVPNPPPMPPGEIQPDDIIKQNDADIGVAPADRSPK